ncbi:hypothetical protein QUB60_20970 [Microcoleus sp. A2-C5]|uniref:hypothetical protein n=1 Tax=Microcoleus sp. A2-C2 TaxID=2818530 RepID=UPI002FD5DD4C
MNSLLLISPYKGSGFKPILSGKLMIGNSTELEQSSKSQIQSCKSISNLKSIN